MLAESPFVYNIDLSEHSKQLFVAADRYGVVGLKELAECEVMNSLSVEDVAEVLVLFEDHKPEREDLGERAMKLVPFIQHSATREQILFTAGIFRYSMGSFLTQ